jgi:CRISPR-associated endonuclease Csn1
MKSVEKLFLGIDVGTTSIGISLLNRDVEGVYTPLHVQTILFPFESSTEYNSGSKSFQTSTAVRRNFRSGRKTKRSKKEILRQTVRFINTRLGIKFNPEDSLNNVNTLKQKGKAEMLSTEELACVIYNYAKYRGFDFELDIQDADEKKLSEYKREADALMKWCRDNSKTVVDYFLEHNLNFHKKTKLENIDLNQKTSKEEYKNPPAVNRKLYQQELEIIINNQSKHIQEIDDNFLIELFDTIYKTKPLKSSKHLLSKCNFEKDKRVASYSNPHIEHLRALEYARNMRIEIGKNKDIKLDEIEIKDVVELILSRPDKITSNQILSVIGRGDKLNFKSVLGSISTAEIKYILPTITTEDLYQVWHKIYSHNNKKHIVDSLVKFGIELDDAIALSNIPIDRNRYSSYSEKAAKKLIPYLNGEKMGLDMYGAIKIVYDDYSNLETPIRQSKLSPLKRGAIRNQVVEKAWNQFASVMNNLISQYGNPSETRIELARELKLPAKVRESITKRNYDNEKVNNSIRALLANKNISPTINTINRIKLWLEQGGKFKLDKDTNSYVVIKNAIDVYTAKEITLEQTFNVMVTNLEHTLCKSRFFTDSLQYMTLAFKDFNQDIKKNRTAMEIVNETFSDEEKKEFYKRVKTMYKGNDMKIKTFSFGYDDMPEAIPNNQLAMTSYIAKQFVENIQLVLDNVYVTSGSITGLMRRELGVTKVIIDNMKKIHPEAYEDKIRNKRDGTTQLLKSEGSSKGKRIDLRNHAVDATIIALTEQGYIQTLNTLNANFLESNQTDKFLENQYKKIFNSIKYKLGMSVEEFFTNIIELSSVVVKKKNYPIINKNGSKGVRGSLHEMTALPYKSSVDVLVEDKKTKTKVFNPKITKDNISSPFVREVVSEYKNPKVAFDKDERLKHITRVYINLDTSDKVKVNNNYYMSGNNFRINISRNKDNGKFEHKIVTLYDLANGNGGEAEIYLHKRDYIILGLSEQEVDELIESNNRAKLYNHLYYIAKIGSDGRIHLQKHYLTSNTILKEAGNFNSLYQKYDGKIVKMKVFNSGVITKFNSTKTVVSSKAKQEA